MPEALRALINADLVVLGPGSLYTSVLPNLLVGGIASTLTGVRAVLVYVANLMTEPGETDGYTPEDHLTAIRAHVGVDLFDYVLVNRRAVESSVIAMYARRGSTPLVSSPKASLGARPAIAERDLAWQLRVGESVMLRERSRIPILELARAAPRRNVVTCFMTPATNEMPNAETLRRERW